MGDCTFATETKYNFQRHLNGITVHTSTGNILREPWYCPNCKINILEEGSSIEECKDHLDKHKQPINRKRKITDAGVDTERVVHDEILANVHKADEVYRDNSGDYVGDEDERMGGGSVMEGEEEYNVDFMRMPVVENDEDRGTPMEESEEEEDGINGGNHVHLYGDGDDNIGGVIQENMEDSSMDGGDSGKEDEEGRRDQIVGGEEGNSDDELIPRIGEIDEEERIRMEDVEEDMHDWNDLNLHLKSKSTELEADWMGSELKVDDRELAEELLQSIDGVNGKHLYEILSLYLHTLESKITWRGYANLMKQLAYTDRAHIPKTLRALRGKIRAMMEKVYFRVTEVKVDEKLVKVLLIYIYRYKFKMCIYDVYMRESCALCIIVLCI